MKLPPKKETQEEEEIKCKIHKAEGKKIECCLQHDTHLKLGHCHALWKIWSVAVCTERREPQHRCPQEA